MSVRGSGGAPGEDAGLRRGCRARRSATAGASKRRSGPGDEPTIPHPPVSRRGTVWPDEGGSHGDDRRIPPPPNDGDVAAAVCGDVPAALLGEWGGGGEGGGA